MGGKKAWLYITFSLPLHETSSAERRSLARRHSGSVQEIGRKTKAGNCFAAYPKNILPDKQGRHIPGHKCYKEGKSYITIPLERLQMLADKFSGTGYVIEGTCKERVNFHEPIGFRVENGYEVLTEWGIIHHSLKGLHIVPSNEYEEEYEK